MTVANASAAASSALDDSNECITPAKAPAETEPSQLTPSNWEFQNRRKLLYALVGYDFGMEPETRLEDIRKYKAAESKFILDALAPTASDRVLDLGSGFGFVSRNFAPLCERIFCADISREFLAACREELSEFSNVE